MTAPVARTWMAEMLADLTVNNLFTFLQ